MDTRADVETDLAQGLRYSVRPPDCPYRPVKGREKAVAGRIELMAAEAIELSPDERVVFSENARPSPIAFGNGSFGRSDNVSEQQVVSTVSGSAVPQHSARN